MRLAWISQELARGQSSSSIVIACMAKFPGVSESVARKDLKEILQRLTEIELENLPEIKTRFMEIGWKLLEECRQAVQYGPAVNHFKTMAAMAGVLTDKGPIGDGPTGVPEATILRERIAQLMKNKQIKKDAEAAGIDLKALHENGE